MRYQALACDYDGTLALHGRVDERTVAALERLLATGRQLVLVTGRELEELLGIFPQVVLFARVVAENGAVLYRPTTKEEKVLAKAPPPEFAASLRSRGVAPMSEGRVVVATWRPHETAVLHAIQEQGLEMQVIFNKDAVMVLPSGVNKATGLTAALEELGLSPHEAVGIGDAENDHAFMALCECAVAVANALPAVKEAADLVVRGDHGAGVVELIEQLIDNDLSAVEDQLKRHHLLLGSDEKGAEIWLAPCGHNLLIAGPSGSGKSTAATSLLERLADQQYQYCIIDPEGDYDSHEGAVKLGSIRHAPTAEEVIQVLTAPRENVVVNLMGLPLQDRPPFFLTLLTRLQEMQAKTGRPHWLVVDEAHHLLPALWEPGPEILATRLNRTVFITVHPEQVAAGALAAVNLVVAVGRQPEETIAKFCAALKEPLPQIPAEELESGEVFLWSRSERSGRRVRLIPHRAEHQRHVRKYAEGQLSPEHSFYFRGPKGKLNLRAQNLVLFLQMADGVDDETWLYHLRKGDYSRWFREAIKDRALADKTALIERGKLSPRDSRGQMRALIEQAYTLPANPPLPMPGTDAPPLHQ